MATFRTFSRSFNGGIVTPEFYGQVADQKFQTGLSECLNFWLLPHGPAVNRPGFSFVRATKDATKMCRLIPFTYSTSQTMVLEFGHQYIRFHTGGATLESSPGTAYEVTTTYDEADLFDLHYVQSNDVLTIVHPNYAPAELRRAGALSWSLSAISLASQMTAPTGVSAVATTATSPSNLRTYSYVVTAASAGAVDESVASSSSSCTNNLLQTGAYNTITWSAVSGAQRYNVYLQSNGLYGYIGQTDGLTFTDDNITPDLSKTPPIHYNPFAGAGDYPAAVTYFEQRRVFAGSTNSPQTVWATKSGTEVNMDYSLPSRSDDSMEFKMAAREANTIGHLVPMNNLVALTGAAEWRIAAADNGALTPSNVSVKPQSYVGANHAQPLVINNALLFASARGGHMRELAYNWQANGYVTGDLSLRAPHLFDGLEIVDMAYAKAPVPIVWAISSSGELLSLTYVPEQQVGAWAHHTTKNGTFESCCVVAEGGEDALYVVVNRTLNGSAIRTVERLASRSFALLEDAFFVDCGSAYSGSATTTVTGLTWLVGETVNILADGAVVPPQVVASGGSITLPVAASKVQVGLPITADIQTLPVAVEVMAFGQGRVKNVNKAWFRVYRSGAPKAGPSSDKLVPAKVRTTEAYGSPTALRTDELDVVIPPNWNQSGQVWLRQDEPLPLTLVGLSLEVEVGG